MTTLRSALFEHVGDQKRVDDYYLPVAEWALHKIANNAKRPYFLGVSGPQGSGKSTLAEALAAAFPKIGTSALTFSTDDFYLTRDAQIALAQKHPENPFFQVRGFAGTHDVDLGARTLASLAAGAPTKIPKYDKSAHDGKGDRAPEKEWRMIETKIDLVIFEGWMLGFHQLRDLRERVARDSRATAEKQLDPSLRIPNQMLGAYDAWNKAFDAFVLLQAGELDFIVKWRIDSEQQRRKKGERTLSDADARAYIERFLPVYRVYVPALAKQPPASEFAHIVLGENRQPTTMFGTHVSP